MALDTAETATNAFEKAAAIRLKILHPVELFHASLNRCLGILVHYPLVRDDNVFVSDFVILLLEALGHESLQVRTRASWSTGMLSL